MKYLLSVLLALTLSSAPAYAAPAPSLQSKLTSILKTYLKERGKIEHITAASASVTLRPGAAPIEAAAGATPSSLFQIGSNTKAFTAVLILQLEAAGKLHIDDPIGRYLPQYPLWKNVTIRRLLNMTSGILTYDNTLACQRDLAAYPHRDFTASQLVAYVYPKNGKATFAPGWNYSNTGYILSQMIIERVTGMKYADVLQSRIIGPLGLHNTYYDPNMLQPPEQARLVDGYFASDDPDNAGLRPLYNKNVKNDSLSWTQAAGGIVATPTDVTRWARVLYTGNILPAKQRKEMMTVVSMKTGKPIAAASAADPRSFGLGVGELMKPPMGRFWFYEGMTLGYRVLHVWLPQNGTVMTVALNSQPNSKDDGIGTLMQQLLQALPTR